MLRGALPSVCGSSSIPRSIPAGTSAKPEDLLDPRFPVYRVGRGGQYTYHGPGQRVAYVMVDLKRRRPDVRAFIAALEGWLISALKALGVDGETREDRVGVWVRRPDKARSPSGVVAEDKIAAIGVRVRRWATFHGVALNVAPDLDAFLRHRSLRHRLGPIWRDKPRRSRPQGDDGRGGRGIEGFVRDDVRRDRRHARRGLKLSALQAHPEVAAVPPSPAAMARRAFWSRLYAQRRLGTGRASALAPLHYALLGERLGYRPNGFFDPKFFRRSAGVGSSTTGLLGLYLARPEPGGPSPSAEFDQTWYIAQNPDWSRTHPHPFLHFLEVGLPAARRPRADIDMAFVRDVIRGKGRSIEEAALRVFDPKPRDGDLEPPLSLVELRARQERFFASARMRIEREAPDRGRKHLVFVQSGQGFDASYLREPRDYDILLNYYHEGEANPLADTAVFQAGTKTTSVRRLLEQRPDLLLRYEAILLLDDDVEIEAKDIDALFAAMAREGLDLAQPALTADSKTAWPSSRSLRPARERASMGPRFRKRGNVFFPPRIATPRQSFNGAALWKRGNDLFPPKMTPREKLQWGRAFGSAGK